MAKVSKRKSVARTRNAGTMTEAQFFGYIRQALREKFRYWKPAKIAKQNASRPYKGPNKLQKKEYKCNKCKHWFKEKEVQVDHIDECGSLRSFEDIPRFLEKLCCELISGFQVLCKKCHKEKTKETKNEKASHADMLSDVGANAEVR